MSKRSYELARRLELGALALEAFASSLTDFEWQSRIPGDGRKIDVVDKMNAEHAKKFGGVTKDETVELLKQNSAAAAAAMRLLTDQELDHAAPVSLYANAILTCQFVLEDHAVRHSYHHLGRIRAALQERTLAKLTA